MKHNNNSEINQCNLSWNIIKIIMIMWIQDWYLANKFFLALHQKTLWSKMFLLLSEVYWTALPPSALCTLSRPTTPCIDDFSFLIFFTIIIFCSLSDLCATIIWENVLGTGALAKKTTNKKYCYENISVQNLNNKNCLFTLIEADRYPRNRHRIRPGLRLLHKCIVKQTELQYLLIAWLSHFISQKRKYFIVPENGNSTTKCIYNDLEGDMIPRHLLKYATLKSVS